MASKPNGRASRHRQAARPSRPPTSARHAEPAPPETPAATLSRPDGIVAATVAALSAVLYATTFSSHVALGDGPESVAGVKTLGILHAPGYPSYVLAARLFGAIVAIGSWSLRTNLFSLVSRPPPSPWSTSSLGCSEPRVPAPRSACSRASTASFWLNATFAKHYAWTGLLLALPILFTALWQEGRSEWWLIGAALTIAANVGSGWQLAAILAFTLVVMVTIGSRSPSNRALVLSGAALALGVVALAAFVLVRAGQDPTLNWGDATNLGRLTNLFTRGDFVGVGTKNAAGPGGRLVDVVAGLDATSASSQSCSSASASASGSRRGGR